MTQTPPTVRRPAKRLGPLIAATTAAACALAATTAAFLPVPAAAQAPARAAATRPAPTTNPVKQLLAEEMNQLEREIAGRMMRRPGLTPAQRARLELEIDLRILQRSVIAAAADAKFDTDAQAAAWIRAKQFRDAARAFEEARAQENAPPKPTPSQQEAIGQLHKLSFTPGGASDEFCRTAAVALVNAVNPAAAPASALPAMRPRPLAGTPTSAPGDRPPTLGELTDEIHRLAAISVPLRQQLLALSAAAAAEKDDKVLTPLLAQAVTLARGLQGNTAVGPEARLEIENQLAEGVALFIDTRTRDAGKARVDGLALYRQTLTRIGKMGLSREQMNQLAPAFAHAHANADVGTRLLATIEQYLDACAQWDALPSNVVALPTSLRRPLEDLRGHFARTRAAFLQEASRIGSPGGTLAALEAQLADAKRLVATADDLLATPASLDTVSALKPRPAGNLEKKAATAAQAAAAPSLAPHRDDGVKYLDALHTLATLTRELSARPATELPPPVVQTWAGNRLDAFERRWQNLALDLANALAGGATELDASRVARLDTAKKLLDALRTAADLEAALPKVSALARWADWAIAPGALSIVLNPYREATAAAVGGFASDSPDAVEQWQRLHARYHPLITLVLRDAAYAEQCQNLPTGLPADAARLATPFDNAPFATERYAGYAVSLWAHYQRAGERDPADRVATALARRLARDLKLDLKIEDAPRPRKSP